MAVIWKVSYFSLFINLSVNVFLCPYRLFQNNFSEIQRNYCVSKYEANTLNKHCKELTCLLIVNKNLFYILANVFKIMQ